MIIKILGSGCSNCQRLEANVKKAIEELKLQDVDFEHITEIDKIVTYGVMSTPALVINSDVKVSGKIPEVNEIKKWLK